MNSNELLNIFFSKIYEKDIHEMLLDDIDFIVPIERILKFVQNLIDVPYSEFIRYINTHNLNSFISAGDITQCSSFEACTEDMCCALLEDENRGKSFMEIGQCPIFNKYIRTPNRVAWLKYGENQVKTANQLGLAFEYYDKWYLSCYGYVYQDLTPDMKAAFVARTLLRNSLYADIVRRIQKEDVNLIEYMTELSSSTQSRRSGSVLKLITFCFDEMDRESIVRHNFTYPKYEVKSNTIVNKVLFGTNKKMSIPHIYDEYREGFIPIYSVRAACGYFDNNEIPEQEGWIDIADYGGSFKGNDYFAVYAKGDSMNPEINDGDLCLFQWYNGGNRNGEIVLTQSCNIDGDYNACYTIKKYESIKYFNGEIWSHSQIRLHPLNRNYEVITLHENDDCVYKTIGIFKQVLITSPLFKSGTSILKLKEIEEQFTTLSIASIKGRRAPHKPILLLSVIDLIACGFITENKIELTEALENLFNQKWKQYIKNTSLFTPKIATPYWHLKNESFWTLCYKNGDLVGKVKPTYSTKILRRDFYAVLNDDIFEYLQKKNNQISLTELIINKYLKECRETD